MDSYFDNVSKLSHRNSEVEVNVQNIPEEPTKAPIKQPKQDPQKASTKLFENKNIQLCEDVFGKYVDSQGNCHVVKRYTWNNHNKIQVQVINFGARIVSIKMPDRTGTMDDIVLGFPDVAGYLHYNEHFFGATIGRMSGVIRKSTCAIDGKEYWLTPNKNCDHVNGGTIGLDKVMWTTYVEGKKVIMSYLSPNLSEGYPGDLLIRIIFELSSMNEFKINFEAQTSQPTIVNLSNLTYFNLGGHHSGPDEIYKHNLIMNCNCFTPFIKGLPSGEILNVIHTEYDFQIPKQLGKVMGIQPNDGFNQNLCINRGVNQGDCFVARLLHPPSGRMLEVYSNQPGVNLCTGNEFGYGQVLTINEIFKTQQEQKKNETTSSSELDKILILMDKMHKTMLQQFNEDKEQKFTELINLIVKLKSHEVSSEVKLSAVSDSITPIFEKKKDFVLTPLQAEYLKKMLNFAREKEEEEERFQLKQIIKNILNAVTVRDDSRDSNSISIEEHSESTIKFLKCKKDEEERLKQLAAEKRKGIIRQENVIPSFYKKTNKIVGKGGAYYTTHGGIALQTQNYPDAPHFSNFPNCVLKPGETYRHSISYKFWIRAGNPAKWIRRNHYENRTKNKICT